MPWDTNTLGEKEWRMQLHSTDRKLVFMDQEVAPGPADYTGRSAFGGGRHFQKADARGVTPWHREQSQRREGKLVSSAGGKLPRYMEATDSFRARAGITRSNAKVSRPPLSVRSSTPPVRHAILVPRSGASPPEVMEGPPPPSPPRRSFSPAARNESPGEPQPSYAPVHNDPFVTVGSLPLPARHARERDHMEARLRRLQAEVVLHQQAAAQQTQMYRTALRHEMVPAPAYSPRRQRLSGPPYQGQRRVITTTA